MLVRIGECEIGDSGDGNSDGVNKGNGMGERLRCRPCVSSSRSDLEDELSGSRKLAKNSARSVRGLGIGLRSCLRVGGAMLT